MRQMVAVPAAQGVVAGVGEKKLQRRRFNVAVAKDHVGFALMQRRGIWIIVCCHPRQIIFRGAEKASSIWNKCFADRHHVAWDSHF